MNAGKTMARIGLAQTFTYEDYLTFPCDRNRYELLEGDLLVTPAPSPLHQRVSKRLQRQLEAYFETRALGEVFAAPIDVILTSHDVFQPDLVVARPDQISDRGIEGPPLLLVEILSPSTRDQDQRLKARRYGKLGVPHYWLVDPDLLRLECYQEEAGSYRLVAEGEGSVSVVHPAFPGLTIHLGNLTA
ncbi:MAG: Uma2 family endonuclease [Nitrospirae bacterium]|nr:MAG: Uma2 family endonuclease [Nitrospirota bacterium]